MNQEMWEEGIRERAKKTAPYSVGIQPLGCSLTYISVSETINRCLNHQGLRSTALPGWQMHLQQ